MADAVTPFLRSQRSGVAQGRAEALFVARLVPHFSGGFTQTLRDVLRCEGVMKGKREMRRRGKKR